MHEYNRNENFRQRVKYATYDHQQTLQKQNEELNEGHHKYDSQRPANYK